MPEVAPLLDALEEILNPRVVTYTGKLYKAWQLLQGVGEEKNPYENVLREVASDLEALNKSLRALNASIGHYIDRLTRNRTPQEVLELFDQYEEKVVAAAYHRFKTSDNLFNYRAYLEEGLDACEETYLPQLALDYARVERCAPGEAAPRVRALIQQQRDALEEMSNLIREIDASHIRYRKRAVQRAQFLLLSDRSSQGSVTALLRRYAEDIRTPDQLFEPDDGPVAAHLHLYPAAAFGEKFLYPPAAPHGGPAGPGAGGNAGPGPAAQRTAIAAGLRPAGCHRRERGPAGTAGTGCPPAGGSIHPGGRISGRFCPHHRPAYLFPVAAPEL